MVPVGPMLGVIVYEAHNNCFVDVLHFAAPLQMIHGRRMLLSNMASDVYESFRHELQSVIGQKVCWYTAWKDPIIC